jgi:uncharacterized protein (DUF3084 family)
MMGFFRKRAEIKKYSGDIELEVIKSNKPASLEEIIKAKNNCIKAQQLAERKIVQYHSDLDNLLSTVQGRKPTTAEGNQIQYLRFQLNQLQMDLEGNNLPQIIKALTAAEQKLIASQQFNTAATPCA